jgi:hypothetical protein
MAACDRIILVHGTGAGLEGKPGHERWWEPKSRFALSLVGFEECSEDKAELVAFKWSGENSEHARREAGRSLSRLLDSYDRDGIGYHLIGHSHGGSVIWHSLQNSAKAGTGRAGLRSWITIGTPFLEFIPRSRVVAWVLLALLVAAILLAAPFASLGEGFIDDYHVLVRETPLWALLLISSGPVAIGAAIFFCLSGLTGAARVARSERPPGMAASGLLANFRTRYLALWHQLDEPVSGLSASLATPPAIAPRIPHKQGGKLVRKWIAALYNGAFPPFIDAFVWWVITGRLQGRDVGGLVLHSCTPYPACFAAVDNGLPVEVQECMSRDADDLASESAQRLRVALHELGVGRRPLASLAQAISWQEVLHTTYFDHARLVEICGLHMRQMRRATAVASTSHDQASGADRVNEKGGLVRGYFEPRSLYLLFGAGALAVLVLVTGASLAVWQSLGLTLTSRYQIDQIAANMQKPEFSRLWESSAPGDVAARLAALDLLSNPAKLLSGIDNPNTLVQVAQRLAYAYGFLGKQAELRNLLASKEVLAVKAEAEADLPLNLRLFGFAGVVDAADRQAEPLAAELMTEIARAEPLTLLAPGSDIELLFSRLLKTEQKSRLVELMGKWTCDDVALLTPVRNSSPEVDALIKQQRTRCGIASTNEAASDVQGKAPKPSSDELRARFAKRAPQPGRIDDPYGFIDEMLATLDVEPGKVADFLQRAGDEPLRQLTEALMADQIGLLIRSVARAPERPELRQRLIDLVIEKQVEVIKNSELHGLRGALGRADYLAGLRDSIGQADFLARIAGKLDSAGRDTSGLSIVAASIYLADGQTKMAVDRLKAGFDHDKPENNSFANAMAIAELAARHDRALAMSAAETGMKVIGTALRVSSIGDPGYSVDDAVGILAQIGEYQRARALAESVGRPLSSPPALDPATSTPEQEKQALQGKGVLGAYVRILDAWIAKTGSEAARNLIARQSLWPETFGMVRTVFNRG